ncbi:Uncharacterized protein BP5553_01805 [Venustampulla echinocandica]|uniref:Impact N-terminal domain-containing protein n=1 Tax=Venustampulla echinocandica TaxID=2656787 RepID=A0A370U225_9HELO|nr:Uncharacterized protein BP5553_01805 [Venustampulla echinocandica]RDL41826.1 Uncharacterized protein BP5553_01805 [Venustampulla echinocandica]
MASQKDVQDLLRLLTTAPGRNKLPMMAAMGRVKALQDVDLRSISDITHATLPTITSAISDEKAAKYLLGACKAHLKSPSTSTASTSKRPTDSDSSLPPFAKRTKSAYSLMDAPQTPQELEASLALPQPSADEDAISKTTIYTNRAPLVLAFALQLLKYTMPEQPLSSKLSLAQAIVSVNSRSKAASLGLERGKSAEELGWGMGQPKVKIMGREISVLKRSGYQWREDSFAESGAELEASSSTREGKEKAGGNKNEDVEGQGTISDPSKSDSKPSRSGSEGQSGWTISAPITSKNSKFVARSITVTSAPQASTMLQTLLSNNPSLESASHNITAYRISSASSGSIIEQSNDDGETGGGRHLLSVLRSSNLTNVLLVVSRWYGGVFLGPDRWRIMSEVSRDALSQRLRVTGVIGHEALWGLDLEGMKSTDSAVIGDNLPIYKPDGARSYILKAFASPADEEGKKKKKSGVALEREKEGNLGLLLGALDLLFKSWVEYIGKEELDRRAWGWYVHVRPDVESGVAGWGGKGVVKLDDILKLRRIG